MTLSKSPASDPKPVNKSGRKRFPLLPVQFQCKLVRHVWDSLFSSFFEESKIGLSSQTSSTIALGRSRKCLKAWGRFLLTNSQSNFFSCLGTGKDTGDLCQSVQRGTPTTCWGGGHISPDQHPDIPQLFLAALLLLLCLRIRVLKTGFI